MAVIALTDGFFSLGGTALSDHVQKVELELTAVELDASSIADNFDVTVLGRRNGSISIDFMDDFASGKTDQVVSGAFYAGALVSFVFRPTSGTVSATNPEYKGSLIPSSAPVGGGQGDLLMKSVTWKTSGTVLRGTV